MKLFCILILVNLATVASVYSQNNITDSIERELNEIFHEDQKYRAILDTMSLHESPERYFEIIKKMVLQDSLNQDRLSGVLPLIVNGDITDLSENSYRACYYVIQHAGIEWQWRYRDFVGWLHDFGKISKNEYMWFIDRLNVRQNKAQKYGLQIISFETGETMPYPIESGCDKRWQDIGLTLPEEFWTFHNVTYQPEFIEQDELFIYGHVFDGNRSGKIGMEHVVVSINGKVTETNRSGYYSYKLKKSERPEKIYIEFNGTTHTFPVSIDPTWDFANLTYQLTF